MFSPLTGLLVEPNPELYAKTKSRERNAWTLPSCFSTKKRPEIVKFDAAGAIGINHFTYLFRVFKNWIADILNSYTMA